MWGKIKHFKPEEFDDKDFPGSHEHMAMKTVWTLEYLRRSQNVPIIVTYAVDVEGVHHSDFSRHNVCDGRWVDAVDFYFKTKAKPREQARAVMMSGFTGIGIYYDWKCAAIGFHGDYRETFQVWKREKGIYTYLLQ